MAVPLNKYINKIKYLNKQNSRIIISFRSYV